MILVATSGQDRWPLDRIRLTGSLTIKTLQLQWSFLVVEGRVDSFIYFRVRHLVISPVNVGKGCLIFFS